MTRSTRSATLTFVLAVALAAGASACGDDDAASTVTLVAHDSFVLTDEARAAFEEATGLTVEVRTAGDAGSLANQAVLTKDDPLGDVLYGIDTTFLTVGLDAGIFEPYRPAALDAVPGDLDVDAEGRVVPVDVGDVCLNYDRSYFEAPGAPALPTSLADLADPAYAGLLVVPDPATSSPGLAFLAATVEEFGGDGWEAYWQALRQNDVAVASDWTDAYYGQFSGGATSEGDRPLVVSYATSPPAEVLLSDPPVDEPPTGVIEASCIRQVEYAGILAGTDDRAGAEALVDFLLSDAFQASVPLAMFVEPVVEGVAVPEAFELFGGRPTDVIEVDPFALGERRQALLDRWTELVLR